MLTGGLRQCFVESKCTPQAANASCSKCAHSISVLQLLLTCFSKKKKNITNIKFQVWLTCYICVQFLIGVKSTDSKFLQEKYGLVNDIFGDILYYNNTKHCKMIDTILFILLKSNLQVVGLSQWLSKFLFIFFFYGNTIWRWPTLGIYNTTQSHKGVHKSFI